MLSSEKLSEIKTHLEKAQNPLFFFDNDADGFCSFIILQKSLGRGKGVSIKSPELDHQYIRKIDELNPDYIFILDKPKVTEDFIEEVIQKNIPLVWIDHHDVEISEKAKEYIHYYNSMPSGEPTTDICQKIFNKQETLWISILGCIGDHYIPASISKFSKENPEICPKKETPFAYLYGTEFGKIIMMINFGLKDTTTNVLNMIKLFINSNSSQDLLNENIKTKQIHSRYNTLNKQVQKVIKKAKIINDKICYVDYAGETSMTSEISNQLSYLYPNKIIFVIYKKSDFCNISLRGKKVRETLLKVIEKIPEVKGGGHEESCGARVPAEKLEEFKKNMIELIEKT